MAYIKMNNNDEHLSIGNFFRLIKEISKNKRAALQSELFCILFEIEDINSTTVNNYCVGARRISDDYKQIYIIKENRFNKNREEFKNIVINLLSIMDGKVYLNKNIDFINNNESLIILCKKLYNIAKNDKSIKAEFINKIKELLKENKYYECIANFLIYIILYKKQPIYEKEIRQELIENILNDTNISTNEICEYLQIKLNESINYDFNLKNMAKKGNALANYELGCNYYNGIYGKIEYDKAYYYFKEASLKEHVGSLYMIGQMFYKGYIGGKTKDDLKLAYEYFSKSCNLGSVAALNKIGLMYLKGIYPLEKNINTAIKYFKESAKHNYVYALNNLGKIYENDGKIKEAFDYYLKSANLGESWACNKMGEYYRLNNDMEKAFKYYSNAIDNNEKDICYYAFYNLAKYFYENGYKDIVLIKDIDKAEKYYQIAFEHGINEAK